MKIKLALREIVHNFGFSLAFLFNLSLGLYGFLLLNSLNISIQDSFQQRSKSLLTADLAISSRRSFTAEEEKIILKDTESSVAITHSVELYSMIATSKGTRLSELVAIEEGFPLYGELELEKSGLISNKTTKSIVHQPVIWISPELSVQMKLMPSDSVKLGDVNFKVADRVEKDSAASFRGFSLAPRIYLGLEQLKKTGLIRLGSTLSYRQFFKFSSEADLEKATSKLNLDLKDPSLQITTHRQAGEQTSRILAYLSDYLGLVTLVGLFLAALGSTFLFQSFFASRFKEIATLMSLGLPSTHAIEVYLIQVLLLGGGAVGLATLATFVTLPLAQSTLSQYLAFSFELKLPFMPLVTSLIVGMVASLLICFPLILRIRSLQPSLLFQESQTQEVKWSLRAAFGFLPAMVFFYSISVWQAHSWKIGSLFAVGLCLSGLLLASFVAVGLRFLSKIRVTRLSSKLALRYLTLNPISTISAFLAIGLGAVLINFLPQIQRNIESEITLPQVSRVPSLFIFDIQEDQLQDLKDFFRAQAVPMIQISPLVRARLLNVAGKPFERSTDQSSLSTREEEQETRMRNRGVNLTFREKLTESETLLEGRPFPGRYQSRDQSEDLSNLPEISVEQRYAKTLGVGLGDVLEFDVQGVAVKAHITSLRKVKWTSFQPNFFVEFQPGVLDDAPKTYIAAIEKLSILDRAKIQNLLVTQFPNISVIDVSVVIERVLDLFKQMSWALRAMAIFSVFTGMVVLFSIARHQAQSRKNEIQLLKLLGGDFWLISTTQWIEFGGMGLFASTVGVLVSLALSWMVSILLFDSFWSFSILLPFVTISGITVLTLLTTTIAVQGTLNEKPVSLLG
jgi:putative ABC transport system permease protein